MSDDRWEWFWSRHSNPASGWSRVPLGPTLVYAVYHRNWRLLGLALLFTVVNPILFPAREDADGWMSRGVRGEQLWMQEGRPVVGAGYPEVLNVGSALASVWTLYSAVKQRPAGTAVGTGLMVGLKLLFVHEVGEHYAETVAGERGDGDLNGADSPTADA